MQTILVAGGAGFIGSHLCEQLLNKNYQVICVDNLLTSNKRNIENLLQNKNFTFIETDIVSQLSPVKSQLSNISYIFHLASPASPNAHSKRSYIAYPIETLQVNSVGTNNLLELAEENNARFVYASTSEVYGDPAIPPQPESYFGNVNPNGIRSVYDKGKRIVDAITIASVRPHAIDPRHLRIFNPHPPTLLPPTATPLSTSI